MIVKKWSDSTPAGSPFGFVKHDDRDLHAASSGFVRQPGRRFHDPHVEPFFFQSRTPIGRSTPEGFYSEVLGRHGVSRRSALQGSRCALQ